MQSHSTSAITDTADSYDTTDTSTMTDTSDTFDSGAKGDTS